MDGVNYDSESIIAVVIDPVTPVAPQWGMATEERRSQAETTAESKRRIIEATLELMAERPFDQITMADIGHRAGISYGSITYHFGSKRGLLLAIFESSGVRFADMLDQLETSPASDPAALDVLTEFFATSPPSAPMILVESMRDPVMGQALAAHRIAMLDRVAALIGGPTAHLEAQGIVALADGLSLMGRLLPDHVDQVAAWRSVLQLIQLGLEAQGRLTDH